jgi:oxygen-dependent protoporphyrinogen oxidase
VVDHGRVSPADQGIDHAEATHDVVVGGGIAGLSAAWELRDRDVLLLEAGDRLGGRLRSDRRGEYRLNYGAHLFPAPGSLVASMADECGLETVPVWGGMMGLAVGSTLLSSGRVESYPLRLPLSIRDKAAFARAGLKVQRAVAAYHRVAEPRPGETAADVRSRVLAYRDDQTFAQFLGPLPAAVEEIFACAARRATAEPSDLSAGCGIGLFALVWGGKRSLIARNLLGGTGQLPAALGARLGERARTGCRVTELRPEGAQVVVGYVSHGDRMARSVRAREVIVAAQAPFAAELVAPLSRPAADALARMTYGPFLSVAVETNEASSMPWDGIYAMATPGRVFDMFTNQAHAVRADGPRRPGGSLLLFCGGPKAAALARERDELIVDRFLDDLRRLYPQTREVVADAAVHRWELGNVYAHPGRHRLQAALEGPLGPEGNVHLAGDYFAELGSMEAAARTGKLAAERVRARLLGASPPSGTRLAVPASEPL